MVIKYTETAKVYSRERNSLSVVEETPFTELITTRPEELALFLIVEGLAKVTKVERATPHVVLIDRESYSILSKEDSFLKRVILHLK